MPGKRTGWMTCIVIGAMVAYAVWNTAVVRHRLIRAEEYRMALQAEVSQLTRENEQLRQEIGQAEDPAVIERLARTQLGLVKPGEIIFCGVEADTRERE